MGLTSRDGIVPLFLDTDIGGPMARTVAVFDMIAGYDPADPASQGKREDRYMKFLDKDGVRGIWLGDQGDPGLIRTAVIQHDVPSACARGRAWPGHAVRRSSVLTAAVVRA